MFVSIQILLAMIIIYTLLSLIINIFIFSKSYRWLLYIVIPIQIFLATFGYIAIEGVMGYATKNISELMTDNKDEQFIYIFHYEMDGDLYLVAVPPNGKKPRMYVFPNDSEEKKKMQEAVKKGLEKMKEKTMNGQLTTGRIIMTPKTKIEWELFDHRKKFPKKGAEGS